MNRCNRKPKPTSYAHINYNKKNVWNKKCHYVLDCVRRETEGLRQYSSIQIFYPLLSQHLHHLAKKINHIWTQKIDYSIDWEHYTNWNTAMLSLPFWLRTFWLRQNRRDLMLLLRLRFCLMICNVLLSNRTYLGLLLFMLNVKAYVLN